MKLLLKAKHKGRGNFKTLTLAELVLPMDDLGIMGIIQLIRRFEASGHRVWTEKSI